MGQSLWGDEIYTYEIATRGSLADVLSGVRSNIEISPPLFPALAWLGQKLGDADTWIRLPSLLAGTAMVPLTYLLGARTVGRTAGLVGAALVALSPFALHFSTEARPYAVEGMLVLVATLALLEALRSGGLAWWAVFA